MPQATPPPAPITHPLDTRICDPIEAVQREHHKFGLCSDCARPEIFAKTKPASKCLQCGRYRELDAITPYAKRHRCLFGASDLGHRTPATNHKTADPVEESAATSIAATGLPPEPHEREAVIVARPRPLGYRADRMALYKMIRQAANARTVCGSRSERDARLRHVEGANVPYAITDRTRDAASQPQTVRGRPWPKQRVEESHRGERAADRSAAPGVCTRAGLRSSRGSAHAPDGRRLSAPTRDFGPTARLRKELLMMAMPHRRGATWRERGAPESCRLGSF